MLSGLDYADMFGIIDSCTILVYIQRNVIIWPGIYCISWLLTAFLNNSWIPSPRDLRDLEPRRPEAI